MTDLSAEERARVCLAAAYDCDGNAHLARRIRFPGNDPVVIAESAIAALIAHEAAAIERAAQVADAAAKRARDCEMFPAYCLNARASAAEEIGKSIRQLHSGESAGRGEDRDGD